MINIVPGFGETADRPLVAHKGVDKIAFTGESTTGKLIMKNAADTLKRVTLEPGGQEPEYRLRRRRHRCGRRRRHAWPVPEPGPVLLRGEPAARAGASL